jgi:hypothetical protein
VDISAPANAIEYHPALLAHVDENGGVGAAAAAMLMPPSHKTAEFPASTVLKGDAASDSEAESDLSDDDWDGLHSDDDVSFESDHSKEALAAMGPAEKAEYEKFGEEYTGPEIPEKDAARLLTLMAHASTCPCQ